MDVKPLIGLLGVVLGVSFAEFNDQVVNLALPDISGGIGLSHDTTSWFTTVYLIGVILGAATGPSLAVIFSTRRFLLAAIALVCVSSLAAPLSGRAVPLLYGARWLEGLGEGAIISNLITVALKVLPPAIRLYGLVFYAMTATLVPSLAASVAALWTDVVGDWRFIFLQSLPLAALSALLVWYGLPQEPPKYENLKTYDWPGALLGLAAFGALAVVFSQGEQYDWFNAPLVSLSALLAAVTLPLFVLWELRAQAPIIGFRLLGKRNLLYPAMALILFIIIGLSASQVPIAFLEQVRGFRPLQSQAVTMEVALAQLVLLPATAWLLDHRWADARAVSAVGLVCIIAACLWGLLVNSAWDASQFVGIQALQAVGQPLVVMPLLMIATNSLTPQEGPIGAALVNAPRALSEAVGAGLLTLMMRWRGALHRDRILDTLGENRIALARLAELPAAALHPQPGGHGPGGEALGALGAAVQAQVTTLTTLDTYAGFAALTLLLLALAVFIPTRTLPPRLELAGES